jgi:hypothetical protein
MFKLTTYHYDDITSTLTKMPHASIIEDAYLNETLSGYEVLINVSMRWPTIDCYGGGSGGGMTTTESITFTHEREGYEGMHYCIEWEVPKQFESKRYNKLTQIEKDQVCIYFIDWDLLEQNGPIIEVFENPSIKLRQDLVSVLNKLGVKKDVTY